MSITEVDLSEVDLSTFANSLGMGYVKPWKANGMIWTFTQAPGIVKDRERLGKYVENCLRMEGFTIEGCNDIADYIFRKVKTIEE
jgi:hypothetical protein